MLELHGVLFPDDQLRNLKRRALFFDKFHIAWLQVFREHVLPNIEPQISAEIEFLISRGIVCEAPFIDPEQPEFSVSHELKNLLHLIGYRLANADDPFDTAHFDGDPFTEQGLRIFGQDLLSRYACTELGQQSTAEFVPICGLPLPASLAESPFPSRGLTIRQDVLKVAFESIPVPDEDCPWEAILDFRADLREKQWGFRRFLKTLSTKQQTEAEIRDDIEWTVNEYRKAMEVHRLKSSNSFFDVFVVTPIEILETLAKLQLSKLLRGSFSARKRQVELLETELKAPGRECAYVFEARRQFGDE